MSRYERQLPSKTIECHGFAVVKTTRWFKRSKGQEQQKQQCSHEFKVPPAPRWPTSQTPCSFQNWRRLVMDNKPTAETDPQSAPPKSALPSRVTLVVGIIVRAQWVVLFHKLCAVLCCSKEKLCDSVTVSSFCKIPASENCERPKDSSSSRWT